MKCPSCGYENPSEGRQDNVCDECRNLLPFDDTVKRNIINASGGRRFVNYVGDYIIFRFVLTALILPFSHTEFIQTLIKNSIQDWIFSIGLLFLYYFMFEAFCQRSLAKFITRTKVVTEDGSKPSITQIFYRTLWRFMPLEPLSFSHGRCWHDPTEATRSSTGAVQFGFYTGSGDRFNGTSAATPNVTGVASLVWSADSKLSASQVKDILSQTAYDLGPDGKDIYYGSGFVNADAAVRRALAIARGAASYLKTRSPTSLKSRGSLSSSFTNQPVG